MSGIGKRECGNCNVCCIIGAVPELSKPAHTPCVFLKDCKKGCCSIFENPDLPDTCRNYECSWKQGFGEYYGRPNQNKVLFSCTELENQVWFTAIEIEENAITEYGANMALAIARETHTPIIVVQYGKRPPEDNGDWVIVTEETLPRCKRIVGEEIHRFDDDVAMYELLKGK